MNNPYSVLGLSPDCTDKQLKKAMRRLSKRWHPDMNPGQEAFAQRKFREVREAYGEILRERATGQRSSYAKPEEEQRTYADPDDHSEFRWERGATWEKAGFDKKKTESNGEETWNSDAGNAHQRSDAEGKNHDSDVRRRPKREKVEDPKLIIASHLLNAQKYEEVYAWLNDASWKRTAGWYYYMILTLYRSGRYPEAKKYIKEAESKEVPDEDMKYIYGIEGIRSEIELTWRFVAAVLYFCLFFFCWLIIVCETDGFLESVMISLAITILVKLMLCGAKKTVRYIVSEWRMKANE